MKKIILVILSLVLITGCGKKEVQETIETNKVNLNELVIEEKQVNDLIFKNTSMIYEQGITTFKTLIVNNGIDIEIKNIYIDCYSKNGLKILTLKKEVNKVIKNKENFQIAVATDIDLTDIYEIKYNLD